MQLHQFTDFLSERLLTPLPGMQGHQAMTHPYRFAPSIFPDNAKQSAVLIGIYENIHQEIAVILIKRTQDNSPHSGQLSFPGGKQEKEDIDLYHTALREAQEEINLDIAATKLVGALSPLYIPVSNFAVHPFIAQVGHIDTLQASPREVANIIHLPLLHTFSSKGQVEVPVKAAPAGIVTTPAYILTNNNYIWGATAMILSELEFIIQQAIQDKILVP